MHSIQIKQVALSWVVDVAVVEIPEHPLNVGHESWMLEDRTTCKVLVLNDYSSSSHFVNEDGGCQRWSLYLMLKSLQLPQLLPLIHKSSAVAAAMKY